MKKFFAVVVSISLLVSILTPSVVASTDEEGPVNNSNLTDAELLNLQIDDIITDNEIIEYVNETETQIGISEEEAIKIEAEILNLPEDEFKIDEETLAYADSINPEIDVQVLIENEELLEQEFTTENDAEALIAPILIRAGITATVALLRKAGINVLKVSYHLGVRMIERGVNPKQVFDAITKGKKYYDPAYKSTVYHYKGVAVGRSGNTLTTTYKQSSPKSRWIKK